MRIRIKIASLDTFKKILGGNTVKVVFLNGKKGNLSNKEAEKLYVANRFTLREWKELEEEMVRLGVSKFEDPMLKMFSADMVYIKYVRNQIKAHQLRGEK